MTADSGSTGHDSNRAIYIDFESLKQAPPNPGLLGVLTTEPDHFEQLILDPVLCRAAKAKPHCRPVSLPQTIAEIVDRADREDRQIVGWSLFERSVVQKSAIPQTVKDRFVARYINGREVASRWKSVLHPDVKLPKDDKFDPRNRLDRFAELTRYRHFAELQGKPAAWLRRVMKAMERSAGRYQSLTDGQKAVWRELLRYNEHDCRALAHVVQKAAFELDKWREYEQTRFCVFDEPRPEFCFTVGSKNSRAGPPSRTTRVDRWAFITAWNPGSVELPPKRTIVVRRSSDRALPTTSSIAGEGVGHDATWSPEPSLMILGIPRKEAIRLGRNFGQLAIVAGHKGFPARLLPCSPLPKLSWADNTPVTE